MASETFPPSAGQAVTMLELFASVGATRFDVTFTDLAGARRGFRQDRPLAEVTRSMGPLVASCTERGTNIIVRPRAEGVTLVQLDDLDAEKVCRIAAAAFLALETSPGSYQSWVAVPDTPLGFTARLRRGMGADLNASGATRVAGTRNFKEKHAPGFPVVRIAAAKPGHRVSAAELDAMGVVAPEPQHVGATPPGGPAIQSGRAPRAWPSYAQVLERAPIGPSGHPSRTSVDFTWCMIALSWGHRIEDTAARLMEASTKAQENGAEYARKTAERAAWAAAQRNAQRDRRPAP